MGVAAVGATQYAGPEVKYDPAKEPKSRTGGVGYELGGGADAGKRVSLARTILMAMGTNVYKPN